MSDEKSVEAASEEFPAPPTGLHGHDPVSPYGALVFAVLLGLLGFALGHVEGLPGHLAVPVTTAAALLAAAAIVAIGVRWGLALHVRDAKG